MKKIVIKVCINCELCKRDVLKAVTKLEGIDQLSVEAEKNTVTVVGGVDPVTVVKQVRKTGKAAEIVSVDPVTVVKQVKKTGKAAEIVSVGPPKPPDRPNSPPRTIFPPLPCCCNDCQLVGFGVSFSSYDDRSSCAIL